MQHTLSPPTWLRWALVLAFILSAGSWMLLGSTAFAATSGPGCTVTASMTTSLVPVDPDLILRDATAATVLVPSTHEVLTLVFSDKFRDRESIVTIPITGRVGPLTVTVNNNFIAVFGAPIDSDAATYDGQQRLREDSHDGISAYALATREPTATTIGTLQYQIALATTTTYGTTVRMALQQPAGLGGGLLLHERVAIIPIPV